MRVGLLRGALVDERVGGLKRVYAGDLEIIRATKISSSEGLRSATMRAPRRPAASRSVARAPLAITVHSRPAPTTLNAPASTGGCTGGVSKRLARGKSVPATTPESDAMSKDLKKQGFTFVGSTICYAFMQATGMVDDHIEGCFRRRGRK